MRFHLVIPHHHLPLSSWTISSHTHWSELSRTAVVKSRSFRLPLKVNLKWIGHFQIEHHERAEIPLTNLQSLSVLFLPHSHQKYFYPLPSSLISYYSTKLLE